MILNDGSGVDFFNGNVLLISNVLFILQEYNMTCLLCGTAAASVSILPEDSNRTNHLF